MPRRVSYLPFAALAVILPLWLGPLLPMVDYPQHLAMAAVVRWYGDSARGFAESFVLAPWRPHALFELLVAGLALLVPIGLAGKLVLSAALAALVPAARAVTRRTGGWAGWAVAAGAFAYGYAFWFGFVGTLLAYPLLLAGVALADRHLDPAATPAAVRRTGLVLALLGVVFYGVHLQFLLLLAGAVGGLTLLRGLTGRGWRWSGLAAVAPGVVLALAALAAARLGPVVGGGVELSALEQAVRATPARWNPLPAKLAALPGLLFGVHGDATELAAMALTLVLLTAAVAWRRRGGEPRAGGTGGGSPAPGRPGAPEGVGTSDVTGRAEAAAAGVAPTAGRRFTGRPWAERLWRHRVAALAAAVFVVYLVVPEWARGYLVAGRVPTAAVLLALCALPVPRPDRRRAAVLAAGGLLALQLASVSADIVVFNREAAGLDEVLAAAEPGRELLGLVFEPSSPRVPLFPVFVHLPAYYQVERGGRVLVSHADFFHAPVRYRAGRDWGVLPALLNERNPHAFDVGRHGPRFDYFLVRAEPRLLPRLFGRRLAEMEVVRSGRWFLLRWKGRGPGAMPAEGAGR